MAVRGTNPLILLQGRTPSAQPAINTFFNARQSGNQNRLSKLQFAEESKQFGISTLTDAARVFVPQIESGDFKGATRTIQRARQIAETSGVPGLTDDFDEMLRNIGPNSELVSQRGRQILQAFPTQQQGKNFQLTPALNAQDEQVFIQGSNIPGAGPSVVPGFKPISKVNTALDIAGGKADIDLSKQRQEIPIEAEKQTAITASKGAAQRSQKTIEAGLAASKGLPILNRALELLNVVQTGGFTNEIRLRVKVAFGIEGADEGELSANLGKAVLSQLRTTFGAQFTQQEGERLARIEAGFGKSPGTNRRLLNQAKQIAIDAARRAQKRAIAQKDFSTAQEIEEMINFKFDIGPKDIGSMTDDELFTF